MFSESAAWGKVNWGYVHIWCVFMILWGLDYGLISRSTKGLLAWGGSTLAGSDKHTLGPVLIPTLLTFLLKTCSRTSFVYSQHDACLQSEERTIRVYKQTLKCYDNVGKVLKLKFFMHQSQNFFFKFEQLLFFILIGLELYLESRKSRLSS